MGLFDSIKFLHQLPLEKTENYPETKSFDFQGETYQTKDLNNFLDYYEARADGTLWLHKHEYEFIEGDPKTKTLRERFGYSKSIKDWWEQQLLTVTIDFYTGIYKNEYKNDYWVEFQAEFSKGILQRVICTQFQVTDNTERKARDAAWKEKEAVRRALFQKPLVKYLYVPYTKTVRWIFRQLRKLKIDWWKIERKLTPL